jgi:hypothetical protein
MMARQKKKKFPLQMRESNKDEFSVVTLEEIT